MNKFKIYDYNEYLYETYNEFKKWPVVYILEKNNKMYIGETANIVARLLSHNKDAERSKLTNKYIIHHDHSNKSLAYFIESDLINRAFADGKNEIINKKMQSNVKYSGHNFYGKETLEIDLPLIWNELRNKGLFKKGYNEIENDPLFKYSPWKEFDEKQVEVIEAVTKHSLNKVNSFVLGGAGTGKTLIIIRTAMDIVLSDENIKIGIYSAKKGNSKTIRDVISGLDKSIKSRVKVLDYINQKDLESIDYILIDEAQRLRRNTGSFGSAKYFDDKEIVDEVFWLNKNNINYTLYFDPFQSFNNKDMDLNKYITSDAYTLDAQYRMNAGNDYIQFIKEFLQIIPETDKKFDFGDYDLKSYESPESLYKKVYQLSSLDKDFDNKARLLASLNYDGREWKTRDLFRNKKDAEKIDYSDIETDFQFGEYKLVWNKFSNYSDWLNKSDVSEVGCVHTAQGRDFSYAGVLFSDDIIFDGVNVLASKEVKHSYFILLTRGIYGHGVYIKDKKLKERFESFLINRIK